MTGLSPIFDHIIEIAGVKISASGEISKFHQLVNPLITLPERTKKYHFLENEDLRDQPTIKNPLKDFCEFYGNLPLLAHNAMFDIGFLVKAIHQYNFSLSLSDIYDSCKFSRQLFKKKNDSPNDHKLSTLAKYFGLEFTHHFALEDAYIALKIMARLLEVFEKENLENLKDLAFTYKLKSFEKNKNFILPTKLKGIESYIQDQKEISILYKGGSTPNTHRTVKPYSLLNLPGGLVLYGLCVKTNMNKYYKLNKIQSFKGI